MFKKIFLTCVLSVIAVISFAQKNDWKEYFGNNGISIQFIYAECHQPAKGLHNEYLLLRLENKTDQEVKIRYKLSKVYNGIEMTGDTADFSFTVPAYYIMESNCDDMKEGLYIYSKILDLKPTSVLNSFELKNLSINGQIIAR